MSAQGLSTEEASRFDELLSAAKRGAISVAQVFEDIRRRRITEAEGRQILLTFENSRAPAWKRAIANL